MNSELMHDKCLHMGDAPYKKGPYRKSPVPWTNLLCELYEIVYLDITGGGGTPQLLHQWFEEIPPL